MKKPPHLSLPLSFCHLFWLFALCSTLFALCPKLHAASPRPNVLFIAIDDLRAELGCYGSDHIISPHIDKLAATGTRFDRAYCQQAICGPSRASVMTGLRPDASQIHGNHTHFRKIYPDIVTLPQHFKNHGYHARSMGKIYHGVFPQGSSRTVADTFGDEPSWSTPTFRPGPRYYYTEEGIAAAKNVFEKVYKPKDPGPEDWTKKLVFGPATEAPDVADNVLYDGQVADHAVASLKELAKSDSPFFLAVGFIKPHSPYIAPKKYWDLYDAEKIPLADPASRTTNAPSIALHGSNELRRYTDQQKRSPIPESDQREVRHAYFACISYIDAQIGRVLDELEKQNLTDDTIVVLWSDHGYHLGEKNLWGKTTNFELDTRVPLIVRVPGKKPGVCESPVELVDLYPTLSDLAGLPVEAHLQGTSLAPAIEDPSADLRTAAYSQYTRGGKRGYTVRTKTHRYTEWIDMKTGGIVARLLFDHRTDPLEAKNLAESSKPELLQQMSALLDRGEGWRQSRTPRRLTLGHPFTDHMVLQRDQPIRLWGNALPNSRITADLPWGQAFATADENGRWMLEAPAFGAQTVPQTIKIRSGEEEVQLKDVLIGDVWICSGQSNMRWMLKQSTGGKEAIAASANPNLRLFNLASTIHPGSGKFPLLQLRNTFADNLYATDGWQVAGPETTPNFSAVAFFFGSHLQQKTKVPIGLIHNSVGGSPMESWIPQASPLPNWIENSDLPLWVAGRARHNLTHWTANAVPPAPHHPFEPGFLFEAGVRPFTGIPVKGILWYQGESNATEDGSSSPAIDPKKNFATHTQLIDSWRAAWNNEALPIYFVQLPGLNRDWAAFREVQQKIDLLVPNTHMAVTVDAGHPSNVHPPNKWPVGQRLARLAAKYEYGINDIVEAPRLTGWSPEGEKLSLQFDRMVVASPDATVSIAGKDKAFKKHKLTQSTATRLTCDANPEDVAGIRYAWENDPAVTIHCAQSRLPVAPFRTDKWELVSTKPAAKPGPAAVPPAIAGTGTSFEGTKPGAITERTVDGFTLLAKPGHAEIDKAHAFRGDQCLRLIGGKDCDLTIRFPKKVETGAILAFQSERWTKRAPFEFRIFSRTAPGEEWKALYDGTREIKVGRSFLSPVRITVPQEFSELKLEATTPDRSGVLIDDLQILDPQPMKVKGVSVRQKVHPVLIGKPENAVLNVVVNVEGTTGDAPTLETLKFIMAGTERPDDVESVQAFYSGSNSDFSAETSFGRRFDSLPDAWTVDGAQKLVPGENHFWLSYRLKPTASLDHVVDAGCQSITIDGKDHVASELSPPGGKRVGYALRQQGQDGVHSTRIPGLATTNKGTLIAVYDNRNRSRGDLPGDIDVGMNRSTDGGQSWEPMKVIMDMGDDPEWKYDGIGDPAVLVDRVNGTIWVAATWSHGNRSWFGSGPGMTPEDTGQFMLVKSEDDGLTWSKPINITKQVKDPKWRFILQGPGKGITLKDGTLVFPAQFRGENEEPVGGKPFSTLIHSKDRGKTWTVGTGVKINTTEAQLVELGDGSIMINCRDNRGGSRSVYTTVDLGKTWQEHPTTRSALPEPVCMASLIRVETKDRGPLLFFSNPPQSRGRHHMTIKASNDEGMTWPEKWHTLVDERATAYSCMTQVGKDHIGLLYEAPGELYFVRYPIDELARKTPGDDDAAVFERGDGFGYRIPALVTATNGDVLAFCERRVGLADHAKNDIVLRRSSDHGEIWTDLQVIADEGGDSLNDPSAIVLDSGEIVLMYQQFPEGYHTVTRGHMKMSERGFGGPRNTRTLLRRSKDHGKTWSEAVDITRSVRRPEAVNIASPGRGIQLKSGRLLFPVYENHSTAEKRIWKTSTLISDDQGVTWRPGNPVPADDMPGFGNENQVVELRDGSVLMSSRNQSGDKLRRLTVSRDKGESWEPYRLANELVSPQCMASVIRHDNLLVHSLPMASGRKNGTILVSNDEGKTWKPVHTITPGGFAYSSLTELANGTIACLYEANGYKAIRLAHIPSSAFKPE